MRRSIASVLFLAALSACGGSYKSHVKVDDVALGRVVVYRNGVAYYERRAMVKGGRLTIVVPRDRVDDLLKSLTVADAKTGEPLSVSFPREQGDYGTYVEMSMVVPTEEAEVVLTYVTEAPAWKPSYRLVVDEKKGKVMLQAWAIIDNTSGEDWNDVILGVGSSSAMSFHYDLWSVRTVARETLQAQDTFAVAPPTAQSTYTQTAQEQQNVVVQLDDSEIRRPEGHPEYVSATPPPEAPSAGAQYDSYDVEVTASESGEDEESYHRKDYDVPKVKKRNKKKNRTAKAEDPTRIVIGGETKAPPKPRDTNASAGDAKVDQLAEELKKSKTNIVIEGYADANEPNADQAGFDRANMVRNQLIDRGVPPAQVRVENKGVVSGRGSGVQIVAEGVAGTPEQADAEAPPVGESHFVASAPMTVARGSSVMASMLEEVTDGEIAYLYDPESTRGNESFAFRAVRVRNPTDSTLEAGPVTVYGVDDTDERRPGEEGGKMIGEGLTEPIPPHAAVVIPFALDRQVVVEKTDTTENEVAKLVTLQRGILTAEVQHIRKSHLVITSRLPENTKTTVYVRHTFEKGWVEIQAPTQRERIGEATLFPIEVEGGRTVEVTIAEATPMVRTLDLNADVTLDMMNVFVQSGDAGDELKAQLKALLAIHKEMVDGKEEIDSLERRLAEYRVRMDELHGQIVTLKAVKGGKDLLKHLETKMKDISNRVQKATIEVVDTEEKIMLARVRFQDALSELHLDDAIVLPEDATTAGTK